MIILSRSIVKGDTFDNGYDVVSDRVSQSASGYLTRGSHRQENDRVGSPFFRDPRFTPTEEWIGGHDLAGELSRGRSPPSFPCAPSCSERSRARCLGLHPSPFETLSN